MWLVLYLHIVSVVCNYDVKIDKIAENSIFLWISSADLVAPTAEKRYDYPNFSNVHFYCNYPS